MLNKIIYFFLHNRLITVLLLIILIVGGIITAPFHWANESLSVASVNVDAIPDIGENQQIVATEWAGRSPKDIQDQITYPLSTALQGIPGVKTIRSTSMFGMSFIYVIFNDNIEFYWSRSRILEKLNSLPPDLLPNGVNPTLGPDATALGQVFWYTLEGRNPVTGRPTGGWDPSELRSIQDYYVKYALASAEGVSEVASIGGFVKEYQVDVKPEALKAYGVNLMQVMAAVRNSNIDVGAETVEMNKAEYLIRGVGYIKTINDLAEAVVVVKDGAPIRLRDLATVNFGPAPRRGGVDKEGVEAVGGVAVARYAANPMAVINRIKSKILEIDRGMPEKVLPDGTRSKVTVVPFYDRSGIIRETVGTLQTALSHEVLIVIIVIVVIVLNLRASVVISTLLPIAVLATFIIMKLVGISANIVALSGIAIAIGVVADVGVVFVENMIRYIDRSQPDSRQALLKVIYQAASEVSGAIFTAMLTTIVSFVPVFALEGQEGKLFSPLAYTKTFVLGLALIIGLVLLPTLSYYLFSVRITRMAYRRIANISAVICGVILSLMVKEPVLLVISLIGINNLLRGYWGDSQLHDRINIALILFLAIYYLTHEWLPLGPSHYFLTNLLFVGCSIGAVLILLWVLVHYYEPILRWCLSHRKTFFLIPLFTLVLGIFAWLGFARIANPLALLYPQVKHTSLWKHAEYLFPGMGNEFMPSLNEGTFLLMPTSVPATGVDENLRLIRLLDRRVTAIPEVERTLGKWGRVQSALDPAPVQMFENTIAYYPEYALDSDGHRLRFKVDAEGNYILRHGGVYNPSKGFRHIPADSLIIDRDGEYLRQWRDHIRSVNDIWNEIIHAAQLPGLTSAPRLQPIEARLVMLSTGLRAPMGLKIFGPDLESIEQAGVELERVLRASDEIIPASVYFDKVVGSPYLEIHLNREKMSRYGLQVAQLQEIITSTIGGMPLTTTVEGRERYHVRLRYPRELRNNPQTISSILVPTSTGSQIPLSEVADIVYERGPQMIKSENTFLTGNIIFDKVEGKAEVDVVKHAEQLIQSKIDDGSLVLPKGVSYRFAGNYEQQQRATQRLLIIIPIVLLCVLLILYFQFKSVTASLIHFSGVFVAFAGGFILLWLYSCPWFMNLTFAGVNLRDLFQIHPINLSVAVWVGFIALFGIATDDGVLMGTYIHNVFAKRNPRSITAIREAVIYAGLKRVRPAAMTTATTLIALLPVMTSTGKGAEIMIPMALPTFGGMLIQSMTMFVVPVLQCIWRESVLRKEEKLKNETK